jgi:hypothetical protein
VSVIPLSAAQEPSEDTATTPTLRLVSAHEHAWELRTVEYDEGLEVRRYECPDCDGVLFR